jgi:hypothetical protein
MFYTRHARSRMRTRKISPAQVESIYSGYESAVPARFGRRNYFKAFPKERRVVRVTVAETPAGPLVVTVAEIPLG